MKLFVTSFILIQCCSLSVFSNKTKDLEDTKLENEPVKEMEYKEGTSVEAKYSLPPVNISSNDGNHLVTSSLSRVLNFYNTELLSANWHRIRSQVSSKCARDVEQYIVGLARAENWALKMDDASGRYSTGWFWGNHYWTGSQSLCENIIPKDQITIKFENHSRVAGDTKIEGKLPTHVQLMGYKRGPMDYTSIPPFSVTFFILRVHLNTSFTTEVKVLHVGLCMPHACEDQDIQKIFEETSKASAKVLVQVEDVRSHHTGFNILEDKTFITLCVVTVMVVLLLITGTLYDIYIEHLRNKIKASSSNGHYADNVIETQLKLDMAMPGMKNTNHGNCGLYVVNKNAKNKETNGTQLLETNNNKTYDSSGYYFTRSFMRFIFKESLMAFSLRANIKAICDQSVGSDTIPVIHGLKSISMAWVILGHTCIVAFKYSDNMEYRKVVEKEFFFQTISNGVFSVDTFFFTSGLLVSFLYFRTKAKGKLDPLTKGNGFISGFLHFMGLIGYRFARLTAPYLFTLGVVEVSMKWFNYNSIFEPPTMDHENCPKYWWRNLLYVNTLFPVDEMCMLWSWYLSDDTQFYVVGAIMLILATSHFKSAAALLLTFMMSSWITTGYIAFSNKHMPGADDPLALFDKIYDKPWTRLGPYLIGMCIGFLLFKKDCAIRFSKWSLIFGWTSSLACLLALVYGLYDVNLSPVIGAIYSSLSHSAWALSLSWIVVACSTGHGGLVNTVLSSTVLYPFSRITYCAYLIHPIVIRVMAMSMDSPLHLGSLVMIIIFLGQVVASYIIAFLVSLAFEAPVVSLLRIIAKVAARAKNQVQQSTT